LLVAFVFSLCISAPVDFIGLNADVVCGVICLDVHLVPLRAAIGHVVYWHEPVLL
jgi:hypothetical protein